MSFQTVMNPHMKNRIVMMREGAAIGLAVARSGRIG